MDGHVRGEDGGEGEDLVLAGGGLGLGLVGVLASVCEFFERETEKVWLRY